MTRRLVADPKPLILNFLSSLPVTIQEHVLAVTLMAFDAYPMKEGEHDLIGLVRPLMEARVGAVEAYKCAAIASVIEVALADPGFDEEQFFKELSDKTGSLTFSRAAAQVPLKVRHMRSARSEFASLRQGPLSIGSLRDWCSVRIGEGIG